MCHKMGHLIKWIKWIKETQEHGPGGRVAGRMGISVASGQGLPNPLALPKTLALPGGETVPRDDSGRVSTSLVGWGLRFIENETSYTPEFVTRNSHCSQI